MSGGTTSQSRRQFFGRLWHWTRLGGLSLVGVWATMRLRLRLVSAATAPPGQHPLRPPGAIAEPEFRATCTRCFLCGEVCSPRAIRFPGRIVGAQPTRSRVPGTAVELLEEIPPSWEGDDTPYILPWDTACNLCMRCGEVCPTGALLSVRNDREAIARDVRMGLAEIDRKICLPWTRRSWCGACFTACPYRELAITVDHQNRPSVHAEHCVGCGLCVEVCPIRHKAIAVVPGFYPDVGRVRPE